MLCSAFLAKERVLSREKGTRINRETDFISSTLSLPVLQDFSLLDTSPLKFSLKWGGEKDFVVTQFTYTFINMNHLHICKYEPKIYIAHIRMNTIFYFDQIPVEKY